MAKRLPEPAHIRSGEQLPNTDPDQKKGGYFVNLADKHTMAEAGAGPAADMQADQ